MDLSDFTDGALWAIEESAMDHMMATIPRLVKTESFEQAAVKIREQEPYEPELTVRDGVAIIPVSGSISKSTGFLSFLFGGASINRIRADIEAAMDDRRVRALVLNVDSPGGRVPGVSELADFIYDAREQKPVVTFSDGNITSAATWIGSAANQKIISPTAQDGSIGVMVMHVDFSKLDERIGIKTTYITAGKYKAIGNDAEPLSDEARKMIEDRLSRTYDVFINDIARFRDADEDTVRQDMAEGRVFVGQQAVDAGLSDRLGSLEDAVAAAAQLAGGRNNNFYQGASLMKLSDITTVTQLQEAFPQLAKDLADQAAENARAGVDTETPKTEGRTEGETQATEKILGLAKVHFGEEAADKFAGVVNSGVTVEQYQAMADALGGGQQASGGENGGGTNDADEQFRQQMAQNIQGAGAPDPGSGGGAGDEPQDFMAAVDAIMAERGCKKSKAMSIAAKQYPEMHQAWITAQQQKQ